MKEQVSVDDKGVKIFYSVPTTEKIPIEKSEYERLKRLDENVRKEINRLKNIIAEQKPIKLPRLQTGFEKVVEQIELLKSLYDETTQENKAPD